MRIVVDTNIIFSSLLNPSGKISDLLINSNDFFKFFAPDFAVTELQKHNSKLLKTSGYTQEELNFLMRMIFKKVELVDLNILSKESKTEAIQITASIDKYDAPFIGVKCPTLDRRQKVDKRFNF